MPASDDRRGNDAARLRSFYGPSSLGCSAEGLRPMRRTSQRGGLPEPLPRPAGSYVLVRLGGNLHARLFNLLVGRGFEVLQDLAEQKECRRP
jgi:hypothetical protein